MAGYRTGGPLEIFHQELALDVRITKHGKVEDKCIICKEELKEPNNLLILHKADGIQVYSICNKATCWSALGEKMMDGKR